MSTLTPTAFAPYGTPAELAKGKRRVVLSLVVAVGAIALAVVASRTVDDHRLVTLYLVAGALHFGACLAAAVRWSRTPEFEAGD
jgi:hypothetical protein